MITLLQYKVHLGLDYILLWVETLSSFFYILYSAQQTHWGSRSVCGLEYEEWLLMPGDRPGNHSYSAAPFKLLCARESWVGLISVDSGATGLPWSLTVYMSDKLPRRWCPCFWSMNLTLSDKAVGDSVFRVFSIHNWYGVVEPCLKPFNTLRYIRTYTSNLRWNQAFNSHRINRWKFETGHKQPFI